MVDVSVLDLGLDISNPELCRRRQSLAATWRQTRGERNWDDVRSIVWDARIEGTLKDGAGALKLLLLELPLRILEPVGETNAVAAWT